MLGVALAAIVVGIIMMFFLPWVGIPVGLVGLVSLEDRLHELASLLAVAVNRRAAPSARCECGAPILWGSHFCANCGRPHGERPVVACASCGAALPAEAKFCASCGKPVASAEP